MGYFGRLYRFWFPNDWKSGFWLFVALAPLYFFQTVVHEGSHSLANALAGDGFVRFAPFPHFNTNFNSFLNGVAFTEGNDFNAMPLFVAAVLVIAFTAIAIWAPIKNATARFFVRILYLGFCIDLGYGTIKGLFAQSSPNSDWGRFTTEASAFLTVPLAWLFWLVMLSHFLWVYYSKWHEVDAAGDRDERGFFDYRLVCMILLMTSFMAIFVFIGVTDATIVKDHWLWWTTLILHILVVAWGVAYMIWASMKYGKGD